MLLKRNNQRGFTLIEMAIVMVLIGLSLAVLSSNLMSFFAVKSQSVTDQRLESIRQAIQSAYIENAWQIDTTPSATLALKTGVFSSGDMSEASAASIALYSTTSVSDMLYDGYGNPFVVFISNPITTIYNNISVTYHKIAVVSSGGKVDGTQTIFDQNTGDILLGERESAILINGLDIQRKFIDKSTAQIEKIANLYEQFFYTRLMNSTIKSISVDYFAQGSGADGYDDTSNPIAKTSMFTNSRAKISEEGGYVMDTTVSPPVSTGVATSAASALGLSMSDSFSPWGRSMYLDNASVLTKNPTTGGGPFTAVIGAEVPTILGGSWNYRSVYGRYE